MSKPSDDLSALFRSLRPDETTFQESIKTIARDAEQRWPLFRAMSPEKPQETPSLSALERERWVSRERPEVGGRKPALSLPGLSDKMSKGLDMMSMRAVKNTYSVKPAVRREPEKYEAEHVVERPQSAVAALAPQVSESGNRSFSPAGVLSPGVPVVLSGAAPGVFEEKSVVPVSVIAERTLSAKHGDDSLKSLFSRLETKAEVVARPAGNRSSFLDRLGRR